MYKSEIGAYFNVEDYIAEQMLDDGFHSHTANPEENGVNRAILSEIENLVSQCSEIQQGRFRLRFYDGLTIREISAIEKCAIRAVQQSIDAVLKKIQNFFDTDIYT
jgi:DNA-directed RNA polymerase specialized sigma24 family protein